MKLGFDHREVASHAAQVAGLIRGARLFWQREGLVEPCGAATTAPGSTFGIGAGIALVLAILVIWYLARTDFALGLAGGSWRSSLRPGTAYRGTAAFASGADRYRVALSLEPRIALVRCPAPASVGSALSLRAVVQLWVDTCIPEGWGFGLRSCWRWLVRTPKSPNV